MATAAIQERFTAALDTLLEEVKEDRSVLAAILCGSLSHDTVWKKSDIDLVLVTIDDKNTDRPTLALAVDGVNIHACLMTRGEFRKAVDRPMHNSFTHSFLTKGRLLYTHDESIAAVCASLGQIGERDTIVQLLRAGTCALPPIDKARKWLVTRGDLAYAALWLLYAATPLAMIEVVGARRLADREVIPQAATLNPAFFEVIYSDLLNTKKTRGRMQDALDAADAYIAARAPSLFAPILDHLAEVGEARSSTELEDYFARHFDVEGVTTACEYLADQRLIGKASTAVRLTARSTLSVQELAFFHTGGRDGVI